MDEIGTIEINNLYLYSFMFAISQKEHLEDRFMFRWCLSFLSFSEIVLIINYIRILSDAAPEILMVASKLSG